MSRNRVIAVAFSVTAAALSSACTPDGAWRAPAAERAGAVERAGSAAPGYDLERGPRGADPYRRP